MSEPAIPVIEEIVDSPVAVDMAENRRVIDRRPPRIRWGRMFLAMISGLIGGLTARHFELPPTAVYFGMVIGTICGLLFGLNLIGLLIVAAGVALLVKVVKDAGDLFPNPWWWQGSNVDRKHFMQGILVILAPVLAAWLGHSIFTAVHKGEMPASLRGDSLWPIVVAGIATGFLTILVIESIAGTMFSFWRGILGFDLLAWFISIALIGIGGSLIALHWRKFAWFHP